MVILALSVGVDPACGQDTIVPRRVVCHGQSISDVIVRADAPSVAGLARYPYAGRVARLAHTVTRQAVIRRFVLLEEGDRCSELRRAESERILRAQPYLADARVVPFDDGRGGVIIEIYTVDEISLLLDAGITSQSPNVSRLGLGSRNLAGEAIEAQLQWRAGDGFRDRYTARLVDYQLFHRPYTLFAEGDRAELGGRWAAAASHPFYTDLQRVAWRVATGVDHGYFAFSRPLIDSSAVGITRRYIDAGGIVRIGEPGRLSLFGTSVTRIHFDPEQAGVLIGRGRLYPDTSRILLGRYRPHQSTRLNALWGVRNIVFMPVEGFDALAGAQDVRTGFQLGTILGRSNAILGSGDNDIFLLGEVYGGIGSPTSFAAFQVQGEGRQNYRTNEWDDVIASGRVAAYLRPTRRNSAILAAEFGGGWQQRGPFQLGLGDERGGVRGFSASRAAGGQRGVVRIEDRVYLGRLRALADVGVGAFVDGGKVWAGDVAFGATTPASIGAGISLLAAVPPRSRKLWRLDIALPLAGGDPDARGVTIRVSSTDATRVFWREPDDVATGRERAAPTSIFNWP
ncbi:MAG: hypothetical protein NVS4B3_02340 [Gemmatimonadaceae bacterium]